MTREPLSAYRHKRDFARTAEPAGAGIAPAGQCRFVVQEHQARRLHWDFRLERDGVLVSWALPRGIPRTPEEHLPAARTEDHPLEYLDFEGTIAEGSYGAGVVTVRDGGTYDCERFEDGKVVVRLHGERVSGRYALYRVGDDDWRIHRMDPPHDPAAEPLPQRIVPMLARLDRLPADEQAYGFEIKWDGIRAIGYWEPGRWRLESRNLRDVTAVWPEVRAIGRQLGSRSAVLDGEIVAFDDRRRPSFERLQRRMHLAGAGAIRRLSRETPAVFIVFDLLWLDGRSLMQEPYVERRRRLEDLRLDGPAWRTPGYHAGAGSAVLRASREQGLEGIVAKRLDSRYEPGRRGPAWIKVKHTCRQELVIGGWVRADMGRSEALGALLVGYRDATPLEAKARGEPPRLRTPARSGSATAKRTAPCCATSCTLCIATPRHSAGGSRSQTRSSSTPCWWRSSSSTNGRPPACCAIRPIRGSAPMSTTGGSSVRAGLPAIAWIASNARPPRHRGRHRRRPSRSTGGVCGSRISARCSIPASASRRPRRWTTTRASRRCWCRTCAGVR